MMPTGFIFANTSRAEIHSTPANALGKIDMKSLSKKNHGPKKADYDDILGPSYSVMEE